MGTGYTRNDTSNNIADGNVINASDLDGEFDAIQSAFDGTTGHSHDGTTGEGPQIDTAGIANDAVTLGTKTSGNYVAAGAVSGVGLSGSASAEGATFTVTSNATDANTASTIVARDASGNFSAGTVTAALTGNVTGNVTGDVTGNADTATTLETARTIAGQSFDGSANITIASTDLSDSGSIDAATLDSIDSTSFLRSDAADTKTSGDLTFSDDVKARFGTSADLQIYHNSSNGHSVITESGTGSLFIDASDLQLRNSAGQTYVNATSGGSVILRHAGSEKLETTSTGVDVTGNITVSGTVDGRDVASDGSKLDGIASSADNYSSWTISDGSNSEAISSGNTLTIAGGGDTSTSYNAGTNTLTVTTNAPEAFTSGTLMLFQQTAAPTGWTKQTTHNDKALRVVSGTAGSGGSSAFSTALGTPSVSGSVSISGNIGNTTLSTSQIPSHSHNITAYGNSVLNVANVAGGSSQNFNQANQATSNTGGGGSHNHGHNMSGSLSSATAGINVQYVDLIIASKD